MTLTSHHQKVRTEMTWVPPEVRMLPNSDQTSATRTSWNQRTQDYYDCTKGCGVCSRQMPQNRRWIGFVVGMIALGLTSIGCVAPAPSKPAAKKDVKAVDVPKTTPEGQDECGRCHKQIVGLIETEGGKHTIGCERCHVQFHVDIDLPGRVPILPKCEMCHEQVHGPDLALCSECHTEVHSPVNIAASRALEHGCYVCHPEADKEMKTHTTQHTELYCHSCHHTRHRYAPACLECHRPHTREMTQADCLMCHPPHKALQVVYPQDIPPETCASCHQSAYDLLKNHKSKHSAVVCAKCHPEHRIIMRCQKCHPEPHGDEMMKKFRVCDKCHGTAHSVTVVEQEIPKK